MHSGDMSGMDMSNLTEQEKETLKLVMERAKQFDKATADALAVPPEGMLLKWTNAFKGWQPRWFTIDPQQGVLHYHMSEDRKKLAPRGSLHLWGALVAPSEEDSQTFTVSGSNGEVYKLRASNARDRQYWVTRVRRQVELCNSKASKESPSTSRHSLTVTSSDAQLTPSTQATTPTRGALRQRLSTIGTRLKPPTATRKGRSEEVDFPGGDAMREAFSRLQSYEQNMEMQIDSYSKQSGLNPLDKNVLMLRASSKAAVSSIKDCLTLIKASYRDPDQLSIHSTGGDGDFVRHNSIPNSPARTSLTADPLHSVSNKSQTSTM